jgi:hemerythrin
MEEFKSYVWKEEYETGISEIDEQHRELFRRIDKLLLAMYKNEERSELDSLRKFMIEYIEDHFTYEENLMKRANYSDYIKHKNEHTSFITLYKSFEKEIVNKGAGIYLANRMVRDLRKWWENHILKVDMLYKPFIK